MDRAEGTRRTNTVLKFLDMVKDGIFREKFKVRKFTVLNNQSHDEVELTKFKLEFIRTSGEPWI